MADIDVSERLANHVSLMLALGGIHQDSNEAVVCGRSEYFWWNDEIAVNFTDYPHILSLIFDPADPDLSQGSVYNFETGKTTFVDPENLRPFARYLLQLVADD